MQWKTGLSALFLIFTSGTCKLKSCELSCKNKGNELCVEFNKVVGRKVCFILMEINLI